MIAVRTAQLPQDAAAILALDTGFTTSAIFDVAATPSGFELCERPLPEPIRKRFPLDDLGGPDRPWSHGFVADGGGEILGFAATGYEAWNRRLKLWHLYVAPAHRGRGVGRALADRVAQLGRELGAREIWLETSNLNVPGVAAYRALGFVLTGLDLTLYAGTPAEGEIALFFSQPLL
jgi:ribosomal protein S18 acetylase RimI-like enzyme